MCMLRIKNILKNTELSKIMMCNFTVKVTNSVLCFCFNTRYFNQ